MVAKATRGTAAIRWLLGPEQPAIRYLALTSLEHRALDDDEVQTAQRAIGERGWARQILDEQRPEGWWVHKESLYRPKYAASNWKLLVLSDLGISRRDRRIAKAAELWIRRFAKPDGGFATDGGHVGHLCITGNTARALVRFGFEDHPAVRHAFEWLVRAQLENGGWSCFGSSANLDSWEGLSAFTAYPRSRWNAGMHRAVERGAEFFLGRELHRQGGRYAPWYRTHYPVHYYYDLLVGLDVLTALGYGDDPRLKFALSWLRDKRRRDGRWNLDAVHPDVEGGLARWYARTPTRAPTPFALERVGTPSKMITLTALRILSRLDDSD